MVAPVTDGDGVIEPPPPPRRRRRWWMSPLTRRVLAVNLLAPILLVVGALFLDTYKQGLLRSEHESLREHAEMIASAVAESAVTADLGDPTLAARGFAPGTERLQAYRLLPEQARHMVRRLSAHSGRRVRLFDRFGNIVADSRFLYIAGDAVEVAEVKPPKVQSAWTQFLHLFNDRVIMPLGEIFAHEDVLPRYQAFPPEPIAAYDELAVALQFGEIAEAIRQGDHSNVLSVAVPVESAKQVVGAVFMDANTDDMDADVFQVRMAILQLFLATLAVTILLSLYQAGTIARPIRRLARAATKVQSGQSRRTVIPDLSNRDDEIGDLSEALRQMTESLWDRIEATERFAADVAHEIKNPLTSLRSAVETVGRVDDPARRGKLLAVIAEDVQRIDRLISDISDLSRVDAEMMKTASVPLNIAAMLAALADIENVARGDDGPRIAVDLPGGGEPLWIAAIEGRIVQVFRNIIGNAVTFSPANGVVTLRAYAGVGSLDGVVVVEVDDEGPGIPEGREALIFDRFYSERPAGEKFGTHSGLGLAISKQIVEGMGGRIVAVNRRAVEDPDTPGARFILTFPLLRPDSDAG